ncbi:MAG: transglutaminase N-terminal domain-containing protein [Acidimicrobiales bacterium]
MSPITYQVRHRTTYRYDAPVSASYGQLHLLPRDTTRQRVRSAGITFEPAVADYREREDFFGNRAGYFALHEPHQTLIVEARSVVTLLPNRPPPAPGPAWEQVRDALVEPRAQEALQVAPFVLASPRVPRCAEVAAYVAPSFSAGRPVLDAIEELTHRIHADFSFVPGATTVTSTLAEVMAARHGVCQDFAHVAVGCVRACGLAARYVSGYLETDPPPGRDKLVGADASHAWAEVWLGNEHGWLGIDPTNASLTLDRHIVTAWGRDYDDVAPLTGVIQSPGSATTLSVSVDVTRVQDEEPPDASAANSRRDTPK